MLSVVSDVSAIVIVVDVMKKTVIAIAIVN